MKYFVKNGVIVAAISIVVFLAVYFFSFETLFKLEYLSLNILVTYVILPILFFILACTKVRKDRNDFYFAEAFKKIFFGGFLVVLVLFVFNMLFQTVIVPDFSERRTFAEKELYTEMYENSGLDEETIAANLNGYLEKKQSVLKNESTKAFGGIVWFAFISLIIAAPNSDKKQKPLMK
jgi:hypothetical protein